MKKIITIFALMMAGFLAASESHARTKVSVDVKSGQTTLIYKYAVYLTSCGHVAYPTFSSRGAKNGEMGSRKGSFIADEGQCKGKRLRSTDIYYRSDPGFRGKEKVKVLLGFPRDSDSDWGTEYKSITFTINVE